jgi:RNA polymerase sigma-70 factor (sigma-E family)
MTGSVTMAQTFEEYAAERLPALLRMATALSGDRGVAEDVVQEVLIRAARRWQSIGQMASPDGYLRRMVINEHQSWRRKWARIVPRAVLDDDRQVPDHAEQHAERDELSRHLDRLPVRQRAVLVLRYFEGMSDEAIAALLGCSTGTVRSHASRALATLRITTTSRTPLTHLGHPKEC